jgi:CRISPR-associated protein Csd1
MMLSSLYAYAQREGLLKEPDFEPRRIDLVLKLSDSGKYLGLVATEQGGVFMSVPRLDKRSSGVAPGFLVDNSKYVLGITGSKSKKDVDRALECNKAFKALLQSAGSFEATEFFAFAQFQEQLDSNRQQILRDRPLNEWTGSENIATQVGDVWIHEVPEIRAAWKEMRKSAEPADQSNETRRCLVTSKLCQPVAIHPSIKRVPGTRKAETALVSFNGPAFCSLGMKQSDNAPVSRAGAEGYVTALNHLLRYDPSTERRFAGGIGIGNDTVVLVWTKDKAPELSSFLDWFDGRSKETAIGAIVAPFSGLAPSKADSTDFYAVTLGGNSARVVVRDWYQSKFGAVKTNVVAWFRDLEIAGQDRHLAIWQILASIDPPGNQGVPPGLAAAFGRAALFGGRIPFEVLRHALLRMRIPPKPIEAHLLTQRVALIKLTLIRSFNLEVSVALNESNVEVPYLLGRLFAVLERLQGSALGDINVTIRDRFFGSASSTPANVFPRLLRLSVHHASKSGSVWLESLKGKIINLMPASNFPLTLRLEEQGLFAVGYYQQRERLFEKKTDVKPVSPDVLTLQEK